MYPVDFQDYQFDGQMPGEAPKISPIGGLVLIGVLLFGLYLLVGKPILGKMTADKKKLEQEANCLQVEALRQAAILKNEAKREEMNDHLKAKLTMVEDKYQELVTRVNDMASSFESVTGISLANAHNTMNLRVSRSIMKSKSFLDAWTFMVNTRITKNALDDTRLKMADMHWNHHGQGVVSQHLVSLDDILGWIKSRHRVLERQEVVLDQLRRASL